MRQTIKSTNKLNSLVVMMKAKYLPNTIQKELDNLSEELYEHKLRDIEARLNEHLQKYIGRDVIFEIDEGFSDP